MRAWITGILAVISLGVLVWGFYIFYERYDDEIWIGASADAKRNPFLAAQRYLAERDVQIVAGTKDLDFTKIATDDLVFLAEVDSMLVSKSQVDAAITWIDNGGFLIVGAGRETQGYASLLRRFNIEPSEQKAKIQDVLLDEDDAELTPSEQMRKINERIKERQAQDEIEQAEKEGLDDQSDADDDDRSDKKTAELEVDEQDSFNEQLFDILNSEAGRDYYKVTLEDDIGEIHLAAMDRILLKHPLVDSDYESQTEDANEGAMQDELSYELLASLADEKGTRFLQFELGDGMFTVLSSSELWENDYIGLADHALFFSYFVPKESQLHFFYNFNVPTLGELLTEYFKEFIFVSLLILLLWLWYRGLRVEREVVLTQGERRNFAEHLQASARFLVVNKQYQPLLAPLQDDIDAQMRPFYPRFSQLNPQSQIAMLIERTELPEKIIQSWIGYCTKVKTQDELLAALKIGNVIRKKL